METKKIRVVAYARVSTGKEDQKNSLDNQRSYFKRELAKNENYTLVSLPSNQDGIYADRGFSGTKLSRPAFDKMLYDAGLRKVVDDETGKETTAYRIECPPLFDIVFVKDTSRFARNVSINDILQKLKDNGVIVHFLDLGKTTADNADVTYVQLFFALAERESRDKSDKTKFGYKEGSRQGRIYAGSIPLGFDYVPINKDDLLHSNMLVPNKDAEIVKTIFNLYTEEELGTSRIEKRLYEAGYKTREGERIYRSTILYMLRNEKYAGINNAGRCTHGDLFNRKLVQVDYNDETRVAARNATQALAEKGVIRIQPIISVEQFQKAQERLKEQTSKYRSKYPYRGRGEYAKKIKCGICGAYYLVSHSVPYKDENGNRIFNENGEPVMRRWHRCGNSFLYGKNKCQSPSIEAKTFDNLLDSSVYYEMKLEMIEELQGAGIMCVNTLNEAISKDNDIEVEKLSAEIDALKEERQKLIPLYARGLYQEEDLEKATKEYTEKIDKLTERKVQLEKSNEEIRNDIERIEELLGATEEEEKNLKQILKSKKYDAIDRKHKLKDIDFISVNPLGDLTIVFNAQSEMQKAIDNIDSITAMYQPKL